MVHHFCNDKCDVAFDSRDKFYDSSATLNICTPQCPPTDLNGTAVSGRDQEFYFWQTTVSTVTFKECKTSCEWADLKKAADSTFKFYKYTRNAIDWCTTVCPPTNIDSSGSEVLTSHAGLFLYNKADTHCVDKCSGTEVFIVDGSDRTSPTSVDYADNFTVNTCRDYCPSDSNSGYSVPQFLTTGTWNSPANTQTHRYCHDNCSSSTYQSGKPFWKLDSGKSFFECTADDASCTHRANLTTQAISKEKIRSLTAPWGTGVTQANVALRDTQCRVNCPFYYVFGTSPIDCLDTCPSTHTFVAYKNTNTDSVQKTFCLNKCSDYTDYSANTYITTKNGTADSMKLCVPKCGALPDPFNTTNPATFGDLDNSLTPPNTTNFKEFYYKRSNDLCIRQCGRDNDTRITPVVNGAETVFHCDDRCNQTYSGDTYYVKIVKSLNVVNPLETETIDVNVCLKECPATHYYYFKNSDNEIECHEACPSDRPYYSVDPDLSSDPVKKEHRRYCVAECPGGFKLYNEDTKICVPTCKSNQDPANNVYTITPAHDMPGFTGVGNGPANEAQKLFRKTATVGLATHNYCVKTCGANEYAYEEFNASGEVIDWFCVTSSECPIVNVNKFGSGLDQNTNPNLYFVKYQVNSLNVCAKDCPANEKFYKYTGTLPYQCVSSCSFTANASGVDDDSNVFKETSLKYKSGPFKQACSPECYEANNATTNISYQYSATLYHKLFNINDGITLYSHYICVQNCDVTDASPNTSSQPFPVIPGMQYTEINGRCIPDCSGIHHYDTKFCFTAAEVCNIATHFLTSTIFNSSPVDKYCRNQCTGRNFVVVNSVGERECIPSCPQAATYDAIGLTHNNTTKNTKLFKYTPI